MGDDRRGVGFRRVLLEPQQFLPAISLRQLAAIFPGRLIGLLQAITWLYSARSAASSLADYGVSIDIDLRTFDDRRSAENAAHDVSTNIYDNMLAYYEITYAIID